MRNRFDNLGKQIGQAALGLSGSTVVHDEISPETQYADLRHDPDPARADERARLGLLGRLAATPALIELYAHAPGAAEFRACLGKHLAVWQKRARDERAHKQQPPPQQQQLAALVDPFLWIIAAGTPKSLLAELSPAPAPTPPWPVGVYLFGGQALRVGLIAASQLPCDRSTLLVRLMAAGPLLLPAVVELSALPADAYERVVADQILLGFQHVLGMQPSRTADEEEFLVTMYSTWEHAREEGQTQGRAEGRAEGKADALLTVLRMRGVPVADAERDRILAERDPARLQRWLERAVSAASLAAVLDDPS
ncbi:MAG TPA: hypothetical protein VNO30_08880 [Kofleriaceae bacterium]|nr:hypothetical protein [Kofleriaceae bacterium]